MTSGELFVLIAILVMGGYGYYITRPDDNK
jgi:hypothetical protein